MEAKGFLGRSFEITMLLKMKKTQKKRFGIISFTDHYHKCHKFLKCRYRINLAEPITHPVACAVETHAAGNFKALNEPRNLFSECTM